MQKILFILLFTFGSNQCHITKSVLEFSPSGLKVWLPDKAAVTRLTFNANFTQQITKNDNKNSEDQSVNLRVGGTIHYDIKLEYQNALYKPTEHLKFPLAMRSSYNCEYSPTRVNGRRSCKGELIFQETFNEISPEKWNVETRFAQEPDYEFVVYQNNSQNLFIENTHLHIKPTLVENRLGAGFCRNNQYDLGKNCTGILNSLECVQTPQAWFVLPPAFSAQISTKNLFSFVYGVMEIRAKLPKGDWIYPQIHLKSKHEHYGTSYDSGLIVVASSFGNSQYNTVLNGGCIFGRSPSGRSYGMRMLRSTKAWSNDFHIFKLEWRPDGISLSVDNEVYGNIYPPSCGFCNSKALKINKMAKRRWRTGTAIAPFDQEMYLSLGVGVGGFVFPTNKRTVWDNSDPKGQLNFYKATDTWYNTWSAGSELIIDYVKVWAL